MKKILQIAIFVLLAVTASASTFAGSADGKKQEPVVDFYHKYAKRSVTLKLSKLKTYNWMLPMSLRREIGDEYYPEIRRQLKTKDSMRFKEGAASVERLQDGQVRLTLDFPNFRMVIREVTWEQLDVIFSEYF